MRPNFIQYTRADGSTFIVGRSVAGLFVIIDEVGHYSTRREAVEVGQAMAGAQTQADV